MFLNGQPVPEAPADLFFVAFEKHKRTFEVLSGFLLRVRKGFDLFQRIPPRFKISLCQKHLNLELKRVQPRFDSVQP